MATARHTLLEDAAEASSRTDLETTRNVRKSRTGCSACKQKRRKCDETRPGCLRCRYHNIHCPGYDQGIKWRPVNMPSLIRNRSNNTQPTNSQGAVPQGNTSKTRRARENATQQNTGPASSSPKPSPRSDSWAQHSSANSPWSDSDIAAKHHTDAANVSFHDEMMPDFTFEDLDIESFDASRGTHFDIASLTSPNFDQSHWPVELQYLSSRSDQDDDRCGTRATISDHTPFEDNVSLSHSQSNPDLDLLRQQSKCSDSPHDLDLASFHNSQKAADLPEDRTSEIRCLFDQKISRLLSISDDPKKNPWLVVAWPLSSNHTPLYHALAAMACFHGPREPSYLYPLGLQHLECVKNALQPPAAIGKNDMAIGAHMATMVALAYVGLWDPEKSILGLSYLAEVKTLIQQTLGERQNSQPSPSQSSSCSYTITAWLYMNVMTRFGFLATIGRGDEEFMEVFDLVSTSAPEQDIDSLVGFASTLFPLLSRLADIVGNIRRTGSKRNSLDQISKASDLRAAFERWSPNVDVDSLAEDKPILTDMIQTAEAYRWAGLLLLRQAVPEVPWAHSQAELAHMTLSYLATIPRESPTAVSHTFPLLVAGVEAIEQDNKYWIRTKWDYMSQTANMPHSNRCRQIAEEVWRRREEFEMSDKYMSGSEGQQVPASGEDGQALASLPTNILNMRTGSNVKSWQCLRPTSNNFPDSLAFKRGIDPYTRAGFTEYTLRGSLHFLTVMTEWQWNRT